MYRFHSAPLIQDRSKSTLCYPSPLSNEKCLPAVFEQENNVGADAVKQTAATPPLFLSVHL